MGCSRLGGNARNDNDVRCRCHRRHLIGERDIAMEDTKTGMKDGRKGGEGCGGGSSNRKKDSRIDRMRKEESVAG